MTLIAAAQLAPILGDLEANRILARDAIREVGEAGAVYNSAAALDAGGLRAVYRKLSRCPPTGRSSRAPSASARRRW